MARKYISRQAPGLDFDAPDFFKNLRGFHFVLEFGYGMKCCYALKRRNRKVLICDLWFVICDF